MAIALEVAFRTLDHIVMHRDYDLHARIEVYYFHAKIAYLILLDIVATVATFETVAA